MAEAVVKTRLVAFLEAHPEGVDPDVLAREALGIVGAKGAIAEKVVSAAIDDDARFARLASGKWALKTKRKAVDFDTALFVSLGCVPSQEGGDEVALAGRRVLVRGEEALFAPIVVGVDSDGYDALMSFAQFAEGAIPVAFRLPRYRSALNRLGRMVLGRSFLQEGICLFRLGRWIFPNKDLPTLEALATELGFSFVTERGADGDASLHAQVLLGLLERCQAAGVDSVETLLNRIYPDATPVQFEAYAFGEEYLRELPETPGVYIMRDQAGQVIYIGKAIDLRKRVGSYFARRSERPEKTQRILDRIWSMEVECVGSELAALLLEAELITVCKPEFNTQVAVQERSVDLGSLKNAVVILPSAEPDMMDLFCLVVGQPLAHLQVQQDLSNWNRVSEQLRALFFESQNKDAALSEIEKGALEIMRTWFAGHKDDVNFVDVDEVGTASDVLRVVGEYVQQCEAEDWEKVAWRV
ncbi:MAG: GIY-YIG nuclease family protein [Candidatus Latescibacteria bacterium]|nr:GIY-YIG nuclease family protein [Candidatus Latescibacterota bacterium]